MVSPVLSVRHLQQLLTSYKYLVIDNYSLVSDNVQRKHNYLKKKKKNAQIKKDETHKNKKKKGGDVLLHLRSKLSAIQFFMADIRAAI